MAKTEKELQAWENELQKEKEKFEAQVKALKEKSESLKDSGPKEDTVLYKILSLKPVERNGMKLNRNPQFSEKGGMFNAGDVIELTPTRMKQLGGETYFKELSNKEINEWESSGHKAKFL